MVAYFSNWFILFPVAFTMFVGVRLARGQIDLGREGWLMRTLQVVIMLMMFYAILAVGLRPSILSIIWLVLLAGFSFVLFWKTRSLSRNALLLTAMSADEPFEQQHVAAHFVEHNRGWVRRRALGLRRDLALGVPWEEALERRGIARGIYERMALRLQHRYGVSSADTFRDESESASSPLRIESEAERLFGRLAMFAWVIKVPLLIALIMTFIVPTFKEMFEEFGFELPWTTLLMIHVSDTAVDTYMHVLLFFIAIVIGAIAMMLLLAWLFPSLTRLPVLRWFCQEYFKTAAFYCLAQVARHEPDYGRSFQAAGEIMPVPFLASRLQWAGRSINKGMSTTGALEQAQLIGKRELAVFGTSLNQSDPTWALQQMSAWKIERMLRRYSTMVQILVIAITLITATVVGLVAIGLIHALVTMIQSVS